MSNKNQMAVGVKRTNPAEQKALDNRSSQLNPNNGKYALSREKNSTKFSEGKEEQCDWEGDTFGDDWEFNYD